MAKCSKCRQPLTNDNSGAAYNHRPQSLSLSARYPITTVKPHLADTSSQSTTQPATQLSSTASKPQEISRHNGRLPRGRSPAVRLGAHDPTKSSERKQRIHAVSDAQCHRSLQRGVRPHLCRIPP